MKDLKSIVGLLNHACKAVHSGRSFLRRLINLTCVRRQEEEEVRVNVEAHSDIEWWHQFAQSWNGISMFSALKRQPPVGVVTTDTSGNWGVVLCQIRNGFSFHGEETWAPLTSPSKNILQ